MPSQHSKKHHAGPPSLVPDPLVDPGNPSHRDQARSTAYLDPPCSRMVALAASSPSRRPPRSPQRKTTTVMLGLARKARGLHKFPDIRAATVREHDSPCVIPQSHHRCEIGSAWLDRIENLDAEQR